jgi:hypothetical protein
MTAAPRSSEQVITFNSSLFGPEWTIGSRERVSEFPKGTVIATFGPLDILDDCPPPIALGVNWTLNDVNSPLTLCELNDAVLVYSGALFHDGCFLYRGGIGRWWYRMSSPPTVLRGVFDSVMAQSSGWAMNPGHWIIDMYAYIVLLPDRLRPGCVVPWRQTEYSPPHVRPQRVTEALALAGFTELYLEEGEFIIAKRLWHIAPWPFYRHVAVAYRMLRSEMVVRLALDRENATNCIVWNRPKGSERHIENANELSIAFGKAFPRLNASVRSSPMSFAGGIREFNTADVGLVVHGAAAPNMIFMQRGSVFIEGVPEGAELYTMRVAVTQPLHYINVRIPGMKFRPNNLLAPQPPGTNGTAMADDLIKLVVATALGCRPHG